MVRKHFATPKVQEVAFHSPLTYSHQVCTVLPDISGRKFAVDNNGCAERYLLREILYSWRLKKCPNNMMANRKPRWTIT